MKQLSYNYKQCLSFCVGAVLWTVNISMSNAEIVDFGACYHERTNAFRCAINSTYCFEDEGEHWETPVSMRRDVPNRDLCQCNKVSIGHCSPSHGSRGICTRQMESCPPESRFSGRQYFYNDGATCMCNGLVGHDYSTNVIELKVAKYGACQIGNQELRCVMNSWDCEATERWLTPLQLDDIGEVCNCDSVIVGACRGALSSYCAVDEDSCDDDSYTFVSPLIAKGLGLDCKLCDRQDITTDSTSDSTTDIKTDSTTDITTDSTPTSNIDNDASVPQPMTYAVEPSGIGGGGISKKISILLISLLCVSVVSSVVLAFLLLKKISPGNGMDGTPSKRSTDQNQSQNTDTDLEDISIKSVS